MKLKVKLKKKHYIIGGITAAAVIAAVLCAVLIPGGGSKRDAPPNETADETNEIVIEMPSNDNSKRNSDNTETGSDTDLPIETIEAIPDGAETISPDEKIDVAEDDETTGEEYISPAIFVTEAPAYAEDEPSEVGGSIVIGGSNPDTEPYSCGADGHHCSDPETHAYILSLELEGCQSCGSHNCASFYATDEWGNTCYTPSKCPKYDIKKDPVYYCQDCGKKSGDGRNGSCVQFVNADNCPNCGEWVEGWTCHSCK